MHPQQAKFPLKCQHLYETSVYKKKKLCSARELSAKVFLKKQDFLKLE